MVIDRNINFIVHGYGQSHHKSVLQSFLCCKYADKSGTLKICTGYLPMHLVTVENWTVTGLFQAVNVGRFHLPGTRIFYSNRDSCNYKPCKKRHAVEKAYLESRYSSQFVISDKGIDILAEGGGAFHERRRLCSKKKMPVLSRQLMQPWTPMLQVWRKYGGAYKEPATWLVLI